MKPQRPFAALAVIALSGTLPLLLALRPAPNAPVAPPMPNGNGGTIVSCGPDHYLYCYPDNWDSTVTYQSANSFPIAMLFNGGSLEPCCDHMMVYDGLTTTAPLIANVNGALAGQFFASTNPNHALTVHWTSDGSISCHTGFETTLDWTVSCLDCTAPTATFDVNLDCANSVFYVVVDITAMGTDPVTTIFNTGGAPTDSASAPGTYQIGPFNLGQQVQVTLVNDQNPLCNVQSPTLTNAPCPIISCGPDNYTHCYQNNEQFVQVFQGNTTYPLQILFNAGQIYQFSNDLLTIYDGLNTLAPVLYQGIGNLGNLAGMTFTSTNPNHALTLSFVSDGFGSCGDGVVNVQWDYTVGCLDCTPPTATFTMNTDCGNQAWTVDVNIITQGTDPLIDITNTGGAPPLTASTPGTYTVGPLQLDVPASITLVNDMNSLCNVTSPVLVNSFCTIVSCGPNTYTHCYQNNEQYTETFQGNSTYPIAIQFNSGQIYQFGSDLLTIYDGLDITAPVLYQGTGNFGDLTGELFISTNANHALTLHLSSDGFTSCGDGGLTVPWNYIVSCLDCTAPVATFNVQLDCANSQFTIAAHITQMGTDPLIDITNTGGAPALTASDTGTYVVGPFPNGTQASVTLVNDLNPLCDVHSVVLTNAPCPVISCGPNTYTYCYADNWDSTIVYQSASTYPIVVQFNAGMLESCCDHLTVYNGPDQFSPQLYYGNGNFGDMTGLTFVSANPQNTLTLHFQSDFSVNCQQFGFTPLNWLVSCLDCTDPGATMTLIPDCIHHAFNVAVDVTDTGNYPTVRIVNSYLHDTIPNVHLGTTMVGPIPVDSTAIITVLHGHNPLCHTAPQTFTYPSDSCVIQACAATTYEYCYGNHDTAYFVYQSGTPSPVSIHFLWGTLLVNDYLQIFDGLDTTATLIYMGNQGGDLADFAINSSPNSTTHALMMRVISNASGSCADGHAGLMHWVVGCGFVGIDEPQDGDFSIYPNPTDGSLYVNLPSSVSGSIKFDVFDITGRSVAREQFNANGTSATSFDLHALATGDYTVVLSTHDWVKAKHLQIAR